MDKRSNARANLDAVHRTESRVKKYNTSLIVNADIAGIELLAFVENSKVIGSPRWPYFNLIVQILIRSIHAVVVPQIMVRNITDLPCNCAKVTDRMIQLAWWVLTVALDEGSLQNIIFKLASVGVHFVEEMQNGICL